MKKWLLPQCPGSYGPCKEVRVVGTVVPRLTVRPRHLWSGVRVRDIGDLYRDLV